MKRREVSWTLTKSWTIILRVQARWRGERWAGFSRRVGQSFCGSRRDEEEGGELDSHEELDNHFAGPGEMKRREVSWTLTKSWTIICGSRRDEEEGGELDSHEELDNHLRVQARWRGGRWAGLSRRVGQSFAGPGEMKRREVSWTLTKSWTIICGSRRDEEEGGELDSHEELDNHLRVQARWRGGRWAGLSRRVGQSFAGPGEMKRREVSWTLTKSWTIICGSRRDEEEGGNAGHSRQPRRDREQGGGAGLRKLDYLFALVVPQQLCCGHRPCDSVPHSSWNSS